MLWFAAPRHIYEFTAEDPLKLGNDWTLTLLLKLLGSNMQEPTREAAEGWPMCGGGTGATSELTLEPYTWSCLDIILRADASRGLLENHPAELLGHW
jgi:hypothetical protein